MNLNLQKKLRKNNKREIIRLIVNVSVITAIIVGVVFVVRRCSSDENSKWELENRPLKIENIRKIAELSTVSYMDELVMDTIEYYKSTGEQFTGNIAKLSDLESWKYVVRGSNIKRRLTLIIGGEVRYGFDLKDTTFKVSYSGDSIFVSVSQPKILDVLVVPSKTSVFQEHGEWNDKARRQLQQKAIYTLKEDSKKWGLEEKSKKQLESLLKKLIADKHTLIVTYK